MPLAFTLLVGVVAAWSWAGLLLAEFGLYGRTSLVASASALSALIVAAIVRKRTRNRDQVDRPSASGWPWIVLWLLLGASLFLRPGEYVIDGGDGSVSLNIGARLATQGTLTSPDAMLARIDPDDWQRLFPKDRGWVDVLNFFPGGVQLEPGHNRVIPGFFHLLPVWIAHATTLIGGVAPHYVTPVAALLSVLALWLLARQLFSLAAANIAALLLCLNFSQIWFARVPSSEILTQLFVLAGLAFATAWVRRPDVPNGFSAGIAFGLAAFTRIDALGLISPVVAAFLIFVRVKHGRQVGWAAMTTAFTVLTAQAVLHALVIARPYTLRVLYFAWNFASQGRSSVAVVLIVAATLALALWLMSGRLPERWRLRPEQWIVMALLAVAAVQIARAPDGYLLKALTPLGLLVAVASVGYYVRTAASPALLLTAGILLVSASTYGGSPHDMTGMPTVLRRFVPVVLPLSLVFAGAGFAAVWRRAGRARLLAIAGAVALSAWTAIQSVPIVRTAPMRGLHDQLLAVDRLLPPGSVILTDVTTPSHFGLSLRNILHRDVLLLQPTSDVSALVRSFVENLEGERRPVVVVVGRDNVPGRLNADQLGGLNLSAANSIAIERTEMVPSTTTFPSAFRLVTSPIDVYVARPSQPAHAPLEADIGDRDLAWQVGGFYAPERMGTAVARWTAREGTIRLPQLHISASAALVLRIAAPRPNGMAAPSTDVLLDATPIGTTPRLAAGFQEFTIPLDDRAVARLAAGPSHLTLRTETFMPYDYDGGTDTRQLGAAIDWIQIKDK